MVIATRWLVIQEPWPGDTNRMAPRGQDKWCNLVGAWLSHMLQGATEVSRIYTRDSRNDIIVRLKKEIDVENLIGAHRWKRFCCILPPAFQSMESYVFEFDRKRLGDPATRQWTEHVGLEHFDGDVSRINLMKPYPPPSWDRPTNKDLKDLATRRMAPLRARTPTPPPRSPTPRPPSPCTPAPVASPPPPNLPEMDAFVPYEQHPHMSAIDPSDPLGETEEPNEIKTNPPDEHEVPSFKLVSKLDPYEQEELAAQALLQEPIVSTPDVQMKIDVKPEPEEAPSDDPEVTRQLQEAFQAYLASQAQPPAAEQIPIEAQQPERQTQSMSRTPQVPAETMAAISALRSATIPSREISRQPTWTPDPQHVGPVKKERSSPPISDRRGGLAERPPFIKPEPQDIGIPPAQSPSGSDLHSVTPQANSNLTSIQDTQQGHPYMKQEPGDRYSGALNPSGGSVKAEPIEAQIPSHQNLIRDPRLVRTQDPRLRLREAAAAKRAREEEEAAQKRIRR